MKNQRTKRRRRIRSKVTGTTLRPRLSVFRSNQYVYAQLIDDEKMVTVCYAKSKKPQEVGAEIAKKAIEQKITKVVFDRSGYQYHGRVKAVAEAAREGGLIF